MTVMLSSSSHACQPERRMFPIFSLLGKLLLFPFFCPSDLGRSVPSFSHGLAPLVGFLLILPLFRSRPALLSQLTLRGGPRPGRWHLRCG